MTETMLPATRHLDSLGDPATSVILSCERAKEWLAVALEGNHIETIIEIKSQAEAMRVYTLQRQLGKDAELSAAEVVRRAERCIGLAIRKGQAEGRIRRQGNNRHTTKVVHDEIIPGPTDFASHGELYGSGVHPGIMSVADDVPAEAFEAAIAEAKAEGNLSRANVVRKVTRASPGSERWDRLAALAAEGHSSHQAATILGVSRASVMTRAKKIGLSFHADAILGKTRRIDPHRVLRSFAETLESLVPSCEQIEPEKIARHDLAECLGMIEDALRAFGKLRTRLRRVAK